MIGLDLKHFLCRKCDKKPITESNATRRQGSKLYEGSGVHSLKENLD